MGHSRIQLPCRATPQPDNFQPGFPAGASLTAETPVLRGIEAGCAYVPTHPSFSSMNPLSADPGDGLRQPVRDSFQHPLSLSPPFT